MAVAIKVSTMNSKDVLKTNFQTKCVVMGKKYQVLFKTFMYGCIYVKFAIIYVINVTVILNYGVT